jgi:hypothetical protein
MATILNRQVTFSTNGTVTAAGLHNLIDETEIYAGIITTQPVISSVGSSDQLLIADADLTPTSAPRRVTVGSMFNDALNNGVYTSSSFTGTLTAGSFVGPLNGNVTGTIVGTGGTISSLTTGTTTSTAATITTGTIPTLVATTLITTGTGTAAAPAIVPTGDSNTGIFFPAADTIAFAEGGTEGMRIDSSGNVGIGITPSGQKLDVNGGSVFRGTLFLGDGSSSVVRKITASTPLTFANQGGSAEMTIDGSGNVLMGKTSPSTSSDGFQFTTSDNKIASGASGGPSALFNRRTDDGIIVQIAQDGTVEGTISVSGTTVSYNGGNLSRFSQLPSGQRDPAIKKGTVLSNLDAMCEWRDADGNLLQNEQLNKVKISDVEGDSNTAGVFVNWDNDDQDNPYDLNMAMTGDMIIRVAQGTSVNRGDLLMSAGDGTAKPQGDDIIRSKTIAKVTSTNVTCTYEDGSYCVPCVLMAC